MLAAVAFLALDLGLAAIAFRRPWVGLVVLLAGLPFSGLVTQVIPRLLWLPGPAELALAGWRDAVLAGIVVAAVAALARSDDRRLRPVEWLVLAVLALGVVYVVASPVPLTAVYVYRVLYEPPLLLAAILVLARTQGMPSWVPSRAALSFVATTAIAAVYAWPQVYLLRFSYLQHFYTDPGDRIHHSFLARGINQPRAIGTMTSPNEFGAVLAITLVLLLTPGLLRIPGWLRSWLIAATGLALLLSFSRSGMLATAVGVVVVLWHSRDRLPGRQGLMTALRDRRKLLGQGTPALVAVVLATLVFTTSGAEKLVAATTSGTDPSAANRPASVRAGLVVLQDHPLGLGLGTAGPKAARFDERSGMPRILTETWYILYAIQVGIGGLILFATLVALILRRLWLDRRQPLSKAVIGFGLGLAIGALFIPIIEDPAVFTPLWGFAGLALAAAASPIGARVAAVTERGPLDSATAR